jgi:hypothetical protein
MGQTVQLFAPDFIPMGWPTSPPIRVAGLNDALCSTGSWTGRSQPMWLTSTIRLVRTLVVVVKPIKGLRNRDMIHLRKIELQIQSSTAAPDTAKLVTDCLP